MFTHNKKSFEIPFACDREFDGLGVFTHNKKGFEMSICL